MKTTTSIFLGLSLLMGVYACKKEASNAMVRVPQLPETTERYAEVGAGTFAVGFMNLDNQKATLGRVLFYDTQLSVNNSVSCGSCHIQQKAFADLGSSSTGFGGGKTSRNTPAIVNPSTQTSYFWDMRETNLQNMVTQPIANHLEMGLEQPEYLVEKLKNLPYYETLFTQAFGSSQITSGRIGEALSHFVSALYSVNSKFDRERLSNFAGYTSKEEMGRQLFFNDLPCGQCHGGDNFSGWGSIAENIGLDTHYVDPGMPGADWMTGDERNGWFKVPSLRNVALTAPYMHDGRFQTLEEVVEFYNSGIQQHDQLSFALREGWNGVGLPDDVFFGNNQLPALRLNLTNFQKEALVAFLHTLTDDQLTTQSKYSNPFVLVPND